jgi:hypothetical protein
MKADSHWLLTTHIRRLGTTTDQLYIRFAQADLTRLGLGHGDMVELSVGDRVRICGVVKTSGGSLWLAPSREYSNRAITELLRDAGYVHGHDVPATVRNLELPSDAEAKEPSVAGAVALGAAAFARPAVAGGAGFDASAAPAVPIDIAAAIAACKAYNVGSYRGKANLQLDRWAYQLFRSGLATDLGALVEQLRFVAEDYGGAMGVYLDPPYDYEGEARRVALHLSPEVEAWNRIALAAEPLTDGAPGLDALRFLLGCFRGSKRWPVWASKTLHFVRPDAFPILDSRAKGALGVADTDNSAESYERYCDRVRQALLSNADVIAAVRILPESNWLPDLKLLDNILFELGVPPKASRAARKPPGAAS